ncbi:hypothetical protein BDV10DRAFT_87364 [Aspergillus recurvatus]
MLGRQTFPLAYAAHSYLPGFESVLETCGLSVQFAIPSSSTSRYSWCLAKYFTFQASGLDVAPSTALVFQSVQELFKSSHGNRSRNHSFKVIGQRFPLGYGLPRSRPVEKRRVDHGDNRRKIEPLLTPAFLNGRAAADYHANRCGRSDATLRINLVS